MEEHAAVKRVMIPDDFLTGVYCKLESPAISLSLLAQECVVTGKLMITTYLAVEKPRCSCFHPEMPHIYAFEMIIIFSNRYSRGRYEQRPSLGDDQQIISLQRFSTRCCCQVQSSFLRGKPIDSVLRWN
jgi:hypothetical protein